MYVHMSIKFDDLLLQNDFQDNNGEGVLCKDDSWIIYHRIWALLKNARRQGSKCSN